MNGEMIVTIVLIVVSGSVLAFLGWLGYRALTPPQSDQAVEDTTQRVAQEYQEADDATRALNQLKRATSDLEARQDFTDRQLQSLNRLIWEMVDVVRALAARTYELEQRKQRYLDAANADDSVLAEMAGMLRGDPASQLVGDQFVMAFSGDYVRRSLRQQASGLEQDVIQLQALGQSWVTELGSFSASLNYLETTLDASFGLPVVQSIRVGLGEAREALGIPGPDRVRELSVGPVRQLESPRDDRADLH